MRLTREYIEDECQKLQERSDKLKADDFWLRDQYLHFLMQIANGLPVEAEVKPVDYGTCKNCKFNLETDEDSLVSECQLTIDEFTGIGIQFSRDFGCNQWQSKPSV